MNCRSLSTRYGLILVLPLALVATGCGDSGPELSPVSGRVTLDGEPVLGARIRFQPEASGGSPSYGSTDGDGRYKLGYKRDQPGALIGWHAVRIDSSPGANSAIGKPGAPGPIPARYNKDSDLRREVKSGEENVFDFELKSDGK
jgi:hypothetical protein